MQNQQIAMLIKKCIGATVYEVHFPFCLDSRAGMTVLDGLCKSPALVPGLVYFVLPS